MSLRITTWNVNGIRNPFGYQPWRDKRTFDGMFDVLEADIIVMQELKIQRKDLRDDMVLIPGWDCYFSLPRRKKGYSGVGIYTRNSVCAPIRAEEGVLGVLCPPNSSIPYCELPSEQHIGGYLSQEQLLSLSIDAAELDSEGRCVVLEFPAFVILGIYSPANSSGLRDDFRSGFLRALDIRIRNLVAMGKQVVVTGDLNVSRQEIDTANLSERLKKEGMSHEDYISMPNRRIFNQLLEGGEVDGERDQGRENPVLWDICRGFHPTRKGMYTHWEQKINARPGNYGSRIDFVLCSLEMKSWFCESDIQEGLMGSDHCPVYAVIKDVVHLNGEERHTNDIMNPPGMFQQGKRLREHSVKDFCPFSAKLMPEFDKRRSIKDMFGGRTASRPTISTQEPGKMETSQASDSATFNGIHCTESRGHDLSSTQKLSQESQASLPTPSPMNSPDKKRRATGPTSNPSAKRSKSGASTMATSIPGKGQQSLKGFFTSNLSASSENGEEQVCEPQAKDISAEEEVSQEELSRIEDAQFRSINEHAAAADEAPSMTISPEPPPLDNAPSPSAFVDPIVSKESWSKLFSKPIAPRCESHSEPCKTMKTKKPGFNCGREFWMCARPLGPTGQKEKNTQWRCSTFIWASDWNASTEQNT